MNNEEESYLEFNFNDVKNRKGEYSALTDIFGIPLFSEAFSEAEEAYLENQKNEKEIYFNQVFSGIKTEAFEDIFEQIIGEEEEIIKKEEVSYISEAHVNLPGILLTVIAMLVFFLVLMYLTERYKKRRKKDEDYIDRYGFENE